MTWEPGEYGIIANVVEVDRIFRMGAKCWLASGTGGEGWYRFVWIGASRSGRQIEKWSPTERFGNFRAAWVPEHLQNRVRYIRGTRPEMEDRARRLNVFADELRKGNRDGAHLAAFPERQDSTKEQS